MSIPFGLSVARELHDQHTSLHGETEGAYDADQQLWVGRPEVTAAGPWCTEFCVWNMCYQRSFHDTGPPVCG